MQSLAIGYLCNDDLIRFADDLFDYDNVSPLDSWSLRMLRRYKVFLDEDFRIDQQKKVRKDIITAPAIPAPIIVCW